MRSCFISCSVMKLKPYLDWGSIVKEHEQTIDVSKPTPPPHMEVKGWLPEHEQTIDVSKFTSLSYMGVGVWLPERDGWEQLLCQDISTFLRRASLSTRQLCFTIQANPRSITRRNVIKSLQVVGELISAECEGFI